MSKILIVEDEETIADLEKDYLELSGFEVEVANDGQLGLDKALGEEFDLIILDLMLPGVDGFEICKQVRNNKNTPIIMVSAKKDDIDKIRGLGLGADDYMTKPFRIKELYARLQALLRRSQSLQDKMIVGNLQIDLQRREVFIEKQEVHLSTIDFDILKMLMIHKNQVLTRSQLLEAIDQENNFVEDNTLSVHVKRLRDKLGIYHGHSYIETVRGIGYRLNKEVLYEDE